MTFQATAGQLQSWEPSPGVQEETISKESLWQMSLQGWTRRWLTVGLMKPQDSSLACPRAFGGTLQYFHIFMFDTICKIKSFWLQLAKAMVSFCSCGCSNIFM